MSMVLIVTFFVVSCGMRFGALFCRCEVVVGSCCSTGLVMYPSAISASRLVVVVFKSGSSGKFSSRYSGSSSMSLKRHETCP